MHHAREEHRPPVAGRRKVVVHAVGDQDADRYQELVERDEGAPDVFRRNLRDIEGRDERCDADRDPDQDPADEEDGEDGGENDHDRAREEDQRCGQDRAAAPHPVGERPPEERPDDRAHQHGAHRHLGYDTCQAELLADEEDRPGDDAGIEPEEDPGNGGNGGDDEDEPRDTAGFRCHRGPPPRYGASAERGRAGHGTPP